MKWNLVIILSLLLLPKQLSKSYFKVFVREKDNIELFEDYLRDYMDRVEKWKDNFYEKLYEYMDSINMSFKEFANLIYSSVEKKIEDYEYDDFFVILSIIQKESAFNPLAYNNKTDDYGIMQISRKNFKLLNLEDWKDIEDNIDAGIKHFIGFYKKYGLKEIAIMAYNNPRKARIEYEKWLKKKEVTLNSYTISVLEIEKNMKKYFEQNRFEYRIVK